MFLISILKPMGRHADSCTMIIIKFNVCIYEPQWRSHLERSSGIREVLGSTAIKGRFFQMKMFSVQFLLSTRGS